MAGGPPTLFLAIFGGFRRISRSDRQRLRPLNGRRVTIDWKTATIYRISPGTFKNVAAGDNTEQEVAQSYNNGTDNQP